MQRVQGPAHRANQAQYEPASTPPRLTKKACHAQGKAPHTEQMSLALSRVTHIECSISRLMCHNVTVPHRADEPCTLCIEAHLPQCACATIPNQEQYTHLLLELPEQQQQPEWGRVAPVPLAMLSLCHSTRSTSKPCHCILCDNTHLLLELSELGQCSEGSQVRVTEDDAEA